MKKYLAIFAVALSLVTGYAMGGPTDAYFNSVTGRIVIPQLKVGNTTYYATLRLTDPAALTFVADLETLTEITAPAGVGTTINTTGSAIVGTWTENGVPGSLRFLSDGTYVQIQGPGLDTHCSAGGQETGSYTWSTETGILLVTVAADGNGQCGLSHPRNGVPLRVYVSGTTMQILEQDGKFGVQQFNFSRTGN